MAGVKASTKAKKKRRPITEQDRAKAADLATIVQDIVESFQEMSFEKVSKLHIRLQPIVVGRAIQGIFFNHFHICYAKSLDYQTGAEKGAEVEG